jgi:phenylacetate-CoA ligase
VLRCPSRDVNAQVSGLVVPPRLLVDPAWERTFLGGTVRRARKLLAEQLLGGAAPRLGVTKVIERAYDSVPFWQRRFAELAIGRRELRDPRAFDALPLLRRAELGREGVAPFLVHPLEAIVLSRGWMGRTSGSTGAPVDYFRDPRTIAWFWAFLDAALAYARRPPLRRGSARVGVVLLDAIRHMPEYEARLPLLHGARFAKRSIDDERRLGPELCALRPRIVTGDPDALAVLGRLDLPRTARPSLVLSSAFAMPARTRRAIEAATGAVVLEYYAAQELGVIALQCRSGEGFHALSGACRVEELEGEIVATPLHNPSFTLIRYAPGDLGRVVDGEAPCACGVRGARIVALSGRAHVRFAAHDGRFFSPGVLTPLLARLPIEEHQIIERATGKYRLRYRGTRTIEGRAIETIETRLAELSGGPIVLELEEAKAALHAPGHKPEPFVARERRGAR